MGIMKIEHLDLFYGDFQALKNVNMEIEKNEITAFIGPPAAANPPSSNP